MKKKFFCLTLFFGLVIASALKAEEYCAFCDEAVLNYQKFYEDELVLALYTHKPVLPGHCLIIPKRHVERFDQLTDEEILQIGQVIKKVNVAAQKVFGTSAYLLHQKNGVEAGQTVFHVHFHYIPKKAGDTSTIKFLLKAYIANSRSPISKEEMEKMVQQMQSALNLSN